MYSAILQWFYRLTSTGCPIIKGENPADYEAFHDQFLAELAPVGIVESMLAERVISLSWRLQRAGRMQNQVIDDMIECKVTNPSAIHHRENHCYNAGIRPGDPRFASDRLPLGRIATSDWSNCTLPKSLKEREKEKNQSRQLIH